jgi:hypothetical protein
MSAPGPVKNSSDHQPEFPVRRTVFAIGHRTAALMLTKKVVASRMFRTVTAVIPIPLIAGFDYFGGHGPA